MSSSRPPQGGAITVAVSVSDPELAEQILAVLSASRGVCAVADEAGLAADVDVVIADRPPATDLPVIALLDDLVGLDAWHADIRAVLLADVDADALLAAIIAVANGLVVFDPSFRQGLDAWTDGGVPHDAVDRAGIALTAREREVLALLAGGASNKLIARRLGISVHTAKFHVASLLAKLGARSRSDAIAIGIRRGLLAL